MSLRLSLLGIAHVHAPSYLACAAQIPEVEIVGIYDRDPDRAARFAEQHGVAVLPAPEVAVDLSDAVVIASENVFHRELAELALAAGCHVLCEKPLATSLEDCDSMIASAAAANRVLMTAFPCPYSPAFQRLQQRHQSGELGVLRAIATTNRGTCPHSWFTQKELSGGGAMIDHVVHVANLLDLLLGETPERVHATVGNQMYQGETEDIAMLTLDYPDGLFVTLDSSWSRPSSYRTWGDVTMTLTYDHGVIEVDLFNQGLERFSNSGKSHQSVGTGSNLDLLVMREFVNAITENRTPLTDGNAGRRAVAIALDGYASLKEGQPVPAR